MLPSYTAFLHKYARILRNSTALLKPQRVAVVVVGNVRDATGALQDLHGDTKRALAESGAVLYSDLVLRMATASAAVRAGRQMNAASKPVTVHQNVVVVCRDRALDSRACREFGIRAGDV